MSQNQSLHTQTLADAIVACIVENIEQKNLKPGTILLSADLARVFNVSRIPVIQATKALTDSGHLSKRDSQGFVVAGAFKDEAKLQKSDLVLSEAMLLRFDRKPSWEKVYERVEHELLGLMPFGSFRINESAMTAHYGVNRSIVQQIVTRLCERGLAEKPVQSYCYLLAYDEDFLRQRFEMRTILEPIALRQSAPFHDRARVLQILDLHQQFRVDFPADAEQFLPGLETMLHVELLADCPNDRITAALNDARTPLEVTTRMILKVLGTEVEKPLLTEHLAVLEALESKDLEGAADALRNHLETSINRSVDRLKALSSKPKPDVPSFLRAL
jgi:DNA-binding GntR family transcriptional regulator